MSLSSQDYAGISDDVYKDRAVGRRAPGKEELVAINGHEYKILEHVDNRLNGYQGTIYQRVDTNEIVVAHRGTEQIARDAILTDGGMVVARTNVQAPDAIALTQRALAYAKKEGQDLGQRPPEVTVTGHSLGGALAQITSHHFNVKGETFNAYGAVSLSYRIPEGGNTMINHVMASDPVSAASPHFGQVRIYARPNEISTLAANGFSNHSLRALIPDRPIIAAGSSFGAHKLGNFLGDGSVLKHPETQKLAKDNARMIEEYRDDVESLRRGVTRAARGIPGGAVDLYGDVAADAHGLGRFGGGGLRGRRVDARAQRVRAFIQRGLRRRAAAGVIAGRQLRHHGARHAESVGVDLDADPSQQISSPFGRGEHEKDRVRLSFDRSARADRDRAGPAGRGRRDSRRRCDGSRRRAAAIVIAASDRSQRNRTEKYCPRARKQLSQELTPAVHSASFLVTRTQR